nr:MULTISPECIES: GNAT family N-acetyltransferase [unclassified Cryobacterium]
MTFEPTPVADTEAHALLSEYFADRARDFPGPQGYRTTFPTQEHFTPPAGVFLVARRDGAAVGCGGIRRIDAGEAGGMRYELKHLYVRPAARGGGVGRAMMTELERRAAEFGAAEVVLDTNASLEAAAQLYRSSGYRDIPAYNDNPNATVWMGKVLD